MRTLCAGGVAMPRTKKKMRVAIDSLAGDGPLGAEGSSDGTEFSETSEVASVAGMTFEDKELIKGKYKTPRSKQLRHLLIEWAKKFINGAQIVKTVMSKEYLSRTGTDKIENAAWNLMESTQMWAKLIYKFEGMTEMINGAFMDDIGELLSSVTGQQRASSH